MRDTVFAPSFGNRPPSLIGREAELRVFLDGLDGQPGSKERAILLLGQRGTGKTVLLWELADRARERGYVVASPTVTSEGMLARIVEKVQDDGERYVPSRATHLTGATVGALGFSAGLQFTREEQETKSPQYKLTRLCRRLSEEGRGVLILVDELQPSSRELRELVLTYAELVGEGLNVAMTLAGLPASVSNVLNDKVLTFLNRAERLSLSPLPLGDVDAAFERAFRSLGFVVESGARELAARTTGGSPYLYQLIGHNLVIRAEQGCTLGEDDVRVAISRACEDFENDVCATTLSALSDRDADFLRAMAQDDGPSSISAVAGRMGVTADYAQKYRIRLLDAGVIESPRRGLLAFAVPYLADYLRKSERM